MEENNQVTDQDFSDLQLGGEEALVSGVLRPVTCPEGLIMAGMHSEEYHKVGGVVRD